MNKVKKECPDQLSYSGKSAAVQMDRVDHEIDTHSICQVAEHRDSDPV